MGMDMSLMAIKYVSIKAIDAVHAASNIGSLESTAITPLADEHALISDEIAHIAYNIANWKNATYIHDWIIANSEFIADDYEGEIGLETDQLEELLEAIQAVIADNSLASDLLPVSGRGDYDEYYFDGLEYSEKVITRAVALSNYYDIFYSASA